MIGRIQVQPLYDPDLPMNSHAKIRTQRLKPALKRFSTMLIAEARWVSGLSFNQLDAALAPNDGDWRNRVSRYARGERTPNAFHVQLLENSVARLLKRKPHTVVMGVLGDDFTALPHMFNRLPLSQVRGKGGFFSYFKYADDWPTFGDLSLSGTPGLGPGLGAYAWQWGVLWERAWPGLSRENFGISDVESIDNALTRIVTAVELDHQKFEASSALRTGLDALLDFWPAPTVANFEPVPVDPVWFKADKTSTDFLANFSAGNLPELCNSRETSPVIHSHEIRCKSG